MTINWSKVLKDSKVKKTKAMVSKVMDDIKVDDNGKGWLYPDDDSRTGSERLRHFLMTPSPSPREILPQLRRP